MRQEWACRVHKQNDLVMDLQQLHVEVPSLIVVQMHCERMFAFEDALLEIHIENNRMMRCRAQELLLHICIQFAQDNG